MSESTEIGWVTKPLGCLADVLDRLRKPITKKDRKAGPYPYYGATGVLDYVDGYLFDEPLVLIGEDGAKWEAGANSAFRIVGKTWVNNHAHVIRPHRNKVLDEWLIYYLNSADLMPFVSGMTVPKLNQGRLREIAVPLPPLEEQQRIVAVLDEAFEGLARARTHAEANLQNSRDLFESYLATAFSGEELGWDVCELSEHVRFIDYRGKTPPKTESGIRLITAKNVKMGFIQREPEEFILENAYEGWMTRGFPKIGDVLFTTEAPLANVAQLDTEEIVVIGQRLITMQADQDVILPEFLKFSLMSPPMQSEIHRRGTGATVVGIKAKLLKTVPLRFPSSLDRQRTIAANCQSAYDKMERLEEAFKSKLQNIEDLRQSLLQKAFAGELTRAEAA